MKWTNHARLQHAYSVRLVGWPADVPMRNPSTLTMAQNQMVLDALTEGRMLFEWTGGGAIKADREIKGTDVSEEGLTEREEGKVGAGMNVGVAGHGPEAAFRETDEDISWAYSYHGPAASTSVSKFLTIG